MENIFYINYRTQSGWLYPILNRLNGTSNVALKERYSAQWHGGNTEIGRLALAVDAKLSKLTFVVQAVDNDVRLLDEELKNREAEVDICVKRHSGLILRNERVALSLPANIESFLYHARSTYELVRRFIIAFSRRVLCIRIFDQDIESVLKQRDLSVWVDLLKTDRDLTAHESTLWCDLKLIPTQPRKYEVLIGEIHNVDSAQYRSLGSELLPVWLTAS